MTDVVRANTRPGPVPLVPEVRLRQADEPFALWERTGETLPFWAFAWAGGQALARYVLDHPTVVAGRQVLDLASGSGLVAIAAALAGAAHVTAADVDPLAIAAITTNAHANNVTITTIASDILDEPTIDADVVLAGDVYYDRAMAARVRPFLNRAARHAAVLVGDPGRAHFPRTGHTALARYDVPVTGHIEAADTTPTTVWQHDRG